MTVAGLLLGCCRASSPQCRDGMASWPSTSPTGWRVGQWGNATEQLWAPLILPTSNNTVPGQGVPETILMCSHAAEVHEVLHLAQCPDRSCCARRQFVAGHAQSHSFKIQEVQGQEASGGRPP